MATVRPFKGIVFDHTRVSDPGLVTCPPYDVISPEQRTELYDRHPYNVVRIISGRDEPDDDEGDNRYTRAASFFRSWLWEGVLREDPEAAVYVYRQAFRDPSGTFRRVWGLLATISLDDQVLAHEHTMSGPKADRLALMQAVPANISPIYALYNEGGGGVSARLEEWAGRAPVADFTDDEHTRHTVWAAHDETFHKEVAEALEGQPIMVADGHHRFETARTYRGLRAEADGPGPWDEIMTLLVDAGAQPVCILPYHRVVRESPSADAMDVLRSGFEVAPLGGAEPARVEAWALDLWSDPTPGTFVAVVGAEAYRLVAPDAGADEIPAAVLRRVALEPMGAVSAEHHLSFTPRATQVCEEVLAGRAVAGFCMQPVPVDKVWELAATGAQMPEKSTYFHPKPKDGIVMRSLGSREEA